MSFNKKIICLAISRKHGGYCIAGKDILNQEWIRPVSNFETEELYSAQIICSNGKQPELFDILEIPFIEEVPKDYQPENILIDEGNKWIKLEKYPITDSSLDELCDTPEEIFVNGNPSYDRVSVSYLQENPIDNSLIFIKPEEVIFYKTRSYTGKTQVRAKIKYNDEDYDLAVTDIAFERSFKAAKNIDFGDEVKVQKGNIYLCVSLGEPLKGNCYKIVTSVTLGENIKSEKLSILDKMGL